MAKPAMTNQEYESVQHQLVALVSVVARVDLKGFLQRIEEAHSIAPVMHPTAYRKGVLLLGKLERLARDLLVFQETAIEFERFLEERDKDKEKK